MCTVKLSFTQKHITRCHIFKKSPQRWYFWLEATCPNHWFSPSVVWEPSLRAIINSRASLLTQIHRASPTAGLCSPFRPCFTFQEKSELVNIVSVMPETSFHATLMCAAARASLSLNSCHPCLPGSSAGLDLPLICRTWQPTLLGTLGLHHFAALCLGGTYLALVRISLKYG